jgi:hypothetical protein
LFATPSLFDKEGRLPNLHWFIYAYQPHFNPGNLFRKNTKARKQTKRETKPKNPMQFLRKLPAFL